jgi:hypothetical protein
MNETMCILGAFFMLTRKKYWELNICDETLGNWGNQGIEVSCKTWLSGGKLVVNRNTWFSHMFRTKPGNKFGFPYPLVGGHQTRKNVRDLLWERKWPGQKKPVSWLVERFWPVKGWTDADLADLKKLERKHGR